MKLKCVLSTEQFTSRQMVNELLDLAGEMEKGLQRGSLPQSLSGKIVACMFFEPSTRTRLSFETAALRLGGQVIGTENAQISSSTVKGEILEDTIRIVSGYADCIVMRHPQDGAAEVAAKVSPVPLINAGDGGNQHPSQALLDLYTIKKEKGRLEDLDIAMVGDLLYGRTIHSTLTLLSLYPNNRFHFIAPQRLALPQKYKDLLKERNVFFDESEDMRAVLPKADVLYMTRVQKERFESKEEYEKLKDAYILDTAALGEAKEDAVIMHALPRINEIALAVDKDPRAAYFRQARNGLYMRMALLHYLLGG